MKEPVVLRQPWTVIAASLLVSMGLVAPSGVAEERSGSIILVGRGPERPVIEKLAQVFERTHVGTVVDIRWNRNFRTADMVRSGVADLAVTGREETGLDATTVAWDGLAVIVNFSNPVTDVTAHQAAALFSGTIRDWSELDEKAKGKVQVVLRPEDQNLTDGFERSLGISGRVVHDAERLGSDQMVLSRVAGQLETVAYVSLEPALEAMAYGLSVRALLIDGVEPGKPTVQSGQYRLRRPVMLLTLMQPKPLAKAFVDFARSPEGQRLFDELYVPLTREIAAHRNSAVSPKTMDMIEPSP